MYVHVVGREMAILIMVKDIISKDLALRDTAQMLFSKCENIPDDIIIDFSDVSSISRSFADEYLIQMEKSKKKIIEKNIPANIQKMFDVVKKASSRTKLIDVDSVPVMTL